MYDLPHFKEHDRETVLAFMKQHPFVLLTGCNESNQPVATQVPVFMDTREEKIYLSGHMMRNTDHFKAFLTNPHVLVVFTGAHTYVSASWYSEKQQASTWNYMSVHARGTLRFLDHNALMEILRRTTNHFENDPGSSSNFEHLPKEYVEKLSRAISAFEIEVTALDNVFKLSQNRDKESYQAIINKLSAGDGDTAAIANEMKKRETLVFKQ